jgi:hypothetical protein
MKSLLSKVVFGTLLLSVPAMAEPLYVNTSPVHYQEERPRWKGERDILKLTQPDKNEESWIYVKYKNGKEFWYENGDNETNKDVVFDREVLEDILENADKIKEMSFYHQHPKTVKGKGYVADFSQIPSFDDFESDIEILEIIHVSAPELIHKIDSRVVVSSGIYVIKYNPQIFHDSDVRNTAWWATWMMRFEKNDFASKNNKHGIDYSFENRKNFAKENKKLAKKFSNKAFKVRFRKKFNRKR